MNFFNKKNQVLIVKVLAILLSLAMVLGLFAALF
jgi:hypothetical protein